MFDQVSCRVELPKIDESEAVVQQARQPAPRGQIWWIGSRCAAGLWLSRMSGRAPAPPGRSISRAGHLCGAEVRPASARRRRRHRAARPKESSDLDGPVIYITRGVSARLVWAEARPRGRGCAGGKERERDRELTPNSGARAARRARLCCMSVQRYLGSWSLSCLWHGGRCGSRWRSLAAAPASCGARGRASPRSSFSEPDLTAEL